MCASKWLLLNRNSYIVYKLLYKNTWNNLTVCKQMNSCVIKKMIAM